MIDKAVIPHIPRQECDYFEPEYEGFPDLHITVARWRMRVFHPFPRITDYFALDETTQVKRLLDEEEEYLPFLAFIEFPTQRGWRETLSIDQDGFARWLTKIQASRVNESRREKLRAFQNVVWPVAALVLRGAIRPLVIPDRKVSAVAFLETRIIALEERHHGEREQQVLHCPHCAGPVVIQSQLLPLQER
jgi:hypothetical protein